LYVPLEQPYAPYAIKKLLKRASGLQARYRRYRGDKSYYSGEIDDMLGFLQDGLERYADELSRNKMSPSESAEAKANTRKIRDEATDATVASYDGFMRLRAVRADNIQYRERFALRNDWYLLEVGSTARLVNTGRSEGAIRWFPLVEPVHNDYNMRALDAFVDIVIELLIELDDDGPLRDRFMPTINANREKAERAAEAARGFARRDAVIAASDREMISPGLARVNLPDTDRRAAPQKQPASSSASWAAAAAAASSASVPRPPMKSQIDEQASGVDGKRVQMRISSRRMW
jgi:hypothetical protein